MRKTGEGKSAVFYSSCCLCGGVILSITPLPGLSAQQCQQMEFLGEHGVHSFHLDTLSDRDKGRIKRFLLSFHSYNDYKDKCKLTLVIFASPNILLKNSELSLFPLTLGSQMLVLIVSLTHLGHYQKKSMNLRCH